MTWAVIRYHPPGPFQLVGRKARHRTMDAWTLEGARITDPDTLSRLREMLANESPLIIEHRFYRETRAPHRFICDDADVLDEYLQESRPGDSFCVWSYKSLCRGDNLLLQGKMPDAQGRTPRGGVA
ncbi:hypothetical protein HNV28_22190 [Myxococcus xanthus]|uniref:Uncharacterized protein n=2 Tax=Myxococcus xanthus TaxID=34 RepID=A0A7Y4IKX6_MYXXA|nr:hypothetical protein [Myxococcus xanthus]NOJ88405.1 hypothetical protein [Myxococcus xanthus]